MLEFEAVVSAKYVNSRFKDEIKVASSILEDSLSNLNNML